MSSHFGLSIQLLDPAFHGRRDGGTPEWPPSPLRVFQSLVAAAAARCRALGGWPDSTAAALRWLEGQSAPMLVAPSGRLATGYRLSVPNNAMDLVAEAWCRGNDSNSGDANPATHKTMKTVRPTRLRDGATTVHYLWPVGEPPTDEVLGHVRALREAARDVVCLGWGVDMAIGEAALLTAEQAGALPGDQWLPEPASEIDGWRVPVPGTLDALEERHERFLTRLGPYGFTAPPPLSRYDTVIYRRATDPPALPAAAFSLRDLEGGGFRPFDPARHALTVAGMMRHATKDAAQQAGWTAERIHTFILGHGEARGASAHVSVGSRRFAYLPLPSIEYRGEGKERAGSVRRVLVAAFAADCAEEMAWARRALPGQELIDEDRKVPVALLDRAPPGDAVVGRYLQAASTWATVTPVVLPGYDDRGGYRQRLASGPGAEEQKRLLRHLDQRIDGLLRKAIRQAGYSPVLAERAVLEWSHTGFFPGVALAARYGVPDHLSRFPRFHVKVRFRDALGKPALVPGPVCLGSGRFAGLGLFVGMADDSGSR